MKLNFTSLAFLCFLFTSQSFAQTEPNSMVPTKFFDGIFDGSSTTMRYRNQHDNAGNVTKDQGQYIVDLRMQFNITSDGKLKLKGRVLSGSKYASDSNDLGVGNNSTFKDDLNLRLLYLDFSPNKKLNFQFGSIPTLPQQVPKSALSVSGNGWVDGARGTYMPQKKWMSAVSVTVGRVDNYTDLNAIHRVGNEKLKPNFLEIHVRGDLNKIMTYTIEGIKLDEQEYLRGMIEIATKDIVKFVDTVVVEELIGTGDKAQKGFALSLKKTIGKYKITGIYSYKTQDISADTAGHLQLEDVFLKGHQLSFIVEHPVGKNGTISARLFKNMDSTTPTWARNGLRAEVNYKITWGKPKTPRYPDAY